ncbi:FKBP-type peptidyl-prolyl cis-trans isomerase [Malonomonas rubra]|uniref:FKBP-type peptidyl-prolyl cis-trans isomerase n=1 Tax=Malonomonas rubra TaxID=57040 RepID=UPI0026ECFA36|nr:FKBP-type peptidyl-prolyl cis-trans isomerase [Malonomonas rubra]
MRKTIVVLLLLLTATTAFAVDVPKTDQEKLGYAIGMNIGMNMNQQNVDADPAQIGAGLMAAMKGEETVLSQEEMAQILSAYQQEMQMKQMAEATAAAEENAKSAEAFLVENGKKEGVKTLASGLQYKVLTEGSGASPSPESMVEVHYKGTLIDGTEFDSSYKRGEPASFPVGGVIPGWTEALQLMKEGDKWELAIPPELAYGERGAPPVIPPNAALVFEVELLKVAN